MIEEGKDYTYKIVSQIATLYQASYSLTYNIHYLTKFLHFRIYLGHLSLKYHKREVITLHPLGHKIH